MSQGAAGPHPVRQRPGRPSNGPAPWTPQGRRSRTAPPGPPPQPALGPSILLRPDAPWRRRPATGSGCRLLERPGKKQLHRKRKRKRKRQHCVWMGIYRLSCCDVQVWAQHSVFPLAWPGHVHTLRTPRPCVPSVPGQSGSEAQPQSETGEAAGARAHSLLKEPSAHAVRHPAAL